MSFVIVGKAVGVIIGEIRGNWHQSYPQYPVDTFSHRNRGQHQHILESVRIVIVFEKAQRNVFIKTTAMID